MAKKASTETEIVRATINRNVAKSPTFVSLYSNDVQVQTSPWDVLLVLGQMQAVAGPDGPTGIHVTQIADLRMSPQLAKKVAMILIQQLKNYEEQMGPIPLPQD
jgi:hypothetical protein